MCMHPVAREAMLLLPRPVCCSPWPAFAAQLLVQLHASTAAAVFAWTAASFALRHWLCPFGLGEAAARLPR